MSHARALINALSPDETDRVEFFNPSHGQQGKTEQRAPQMPQPRLLRNPDPDMISFIVGGNLHNILALFEHPSPGAWPTPSTPKPTRWSAATVAILMMTVLVVLMTAFVGLFIWPVLFLTVGFLYRWVTLG